MANGYATETLDEAAYDEGAYDEGWGDEGFEPEAARGRGGRGRPSPAQPRGGGYAPPPQASSQYVSQAQLEKALNAVREDMQKNARAITAAGAQFDALSSRVRREINRSRDEARNTTQMLTLLPLLTQKSLTTSAEIDGPDSKPVIPSGTKLSVAPDSINAILPLLLISGSFGGSSSSGQSGQDNNMLMLVLAMSFLNK